MNAGSGLVLPLHYAAARPPGWWGMGWTIAADAALFASLAFAYLYLWTSSPAWPPPGCREMGWEMPAIGVALQVASSVFLVAGERDRRTALHGSLLAAAALGLTFIVLLAISLLDSGLSAQAHAYGAVVHALWVCAAFHVALGVVMAAFVFVRSLTKYATAERPGEVRIAAMFWHYATLQTVIVFLLLFLIPSVIG